MTSNAGKAVINKNEMWCIISKRTMQRFSGTAGDYFYSLLFKYDTADIQDIGIIIAEKNAFFHEQYG